jgi:hypothetical protein
MRVGLVGLAHESSNLSVGIFVDSERGLNRARGRIQLLLPDMC